MTVSQEGMLHLLERESLIVSKEAGFLLSQAPPPSPSAKAESLHNHGDAKEVHTQLNGASVEDVPVLLVTKPWAPVVRNTLRHHDWNDLKHQVVEVQAATELQFPPESGTGGGGGGLSLTEILAGGVLALPLTLSAERSLLGHLASETASSLVSSSEVLVKALALQGATLPKRKQKQKQKGQKKESVEGEQSKPQTIPRLILCLARSALPVLGKSRKRAKQKASRTRDKIALNRVVALAATGKGPPGTPATSGRTETARKTKTAQTGLKQLVAEIYHRAYSAYSVPQRDGQRQPGEAETQAEEQPSVLSSVLECLPLKWEKLGDCVLIPHHSLSPQDPRCSHFLGLLSRGSEKAGRLESFSEEDRPPTLEDLWATVADYALGRNQALHNREKRSQRVSIPGQQGLQVKRTARLGRQAVVRSGLKRESGVEMLLTDERGERLHAMSYLFNLYVSQYFHAFSSCSSDFSSFLMERKGKEPKGRGGEGTRRFAPNQSQSTGEQKAPACIDVLLAHTLVLLIPPIQVDGWNIVKIRYGQLFVSIDRNAPLLLKALPMKRFQVFVIDTSPRLESERGIICFANQSLSIANLPAYCRTRVQTLKCFIFARYVLDVTKSMFSSGNISEKLRMARYQSRHSCTFLSRGPKNTRCVCFFTDSLQKHLRRKRMQR